MAAALLSNAVYCESCATDFLASTDCLGSIDAAFDTYDPIGNEFSLIAAARIACTAYAVTLTADQGALRVPKSYRQAMSSPQAEQWREAINKELSGLVALDTWDLVPIASAPPPPFDACEPCDSYSPMPWKIRVYRNLHLAFSLHDDALAALYARLLHLYIWAYV